MDDPNSLLGVGTFVSAFVGAAIGVFVDRVWRRIETVPLFRVQLGGYQDEAGMGISLWVENVGLDPLPQYDISLFHPDRGTLNVFNGGSEGRIFPQYPQQVNGFQCLTKPTEDLHDDQNFLRTWLHQVRDEEVAAPHFAGFKLRLVMKNSEQVLFEDEGLGNSIASQIYRDVMGKRTEQPVENVYYRSKAPFWVEFVRRYRYRRMIRSVMKEKDGSSSR